MIFQKPPTGSYCGAIGLGNQFSVLGLALDNPLGPFGLLQTAR